MKKKQKKYLINVHQNPDRMNQMKGDLFIFNKKPTTKILMDFIYEQDYDSILEQIYNFPRNKVIILENNIDITPIEVYK